MWEESFSFPCDDEGDTLEVLVEDYDLVSANDFMGSVVVAARDLADRRCHRAWHRLLRKDGALGVGAVELCLRRRHDPALSLPTPEAFTKDETHPAAAANVLRVHVIRAKGLPIADKNIFSKGGSSDPVCVLSVGGAVLRGYQSGLEIRQS